MSDQLFRVIDWLDDVLAWLREPRTEVPVVELLARLRVTFDCTGVSWHRQRGVLLTDTVFDPPEALDSLQAGMEEFQAGVNRDCHPLSVWYERTASTSPQTCDRVPTALVPTKRRMILAEPLIRLGFEQQLTLYQHRSAALSTFFVVARSGRDFDDADLLLAGYVHRSLVTLDRQTRTLRGPSDDSAAPRRADLGLTGRQLAVLQLISDGLSTRQAARRLACSPRTVEKHLQHSYRKLEVQDRVNAIRVARLAGAVLERAPGAT